jgi:hypothetical protein
MSSWLQKIIDWAECLSVDETIKDTINGIPCEIEYRSKLTGNVVGYWAYGYYDPNLPYNGDKV